MNSSPRIRLLILQTHPIQYFAPLFRTLTARGNLDVVVVYLSDAGASRHFDPGFGRAVEWDVDLLSGYRHLVLSPGSSINDKGFLGRHSWRISSVLRRERPDWVHVHGYASLANWHATLVSRATGVKLLYGSDSNARIQRPRHRQHLKQVPVRMFLSQMDRLLWTAEANKDYLLQFGVRPERLQWSPFAVDVRRFQAEAKPPDERKYDFAFLGKLIPRKRGRDFIAALQRLRSRGRTFRAIIGGDGPEHGVLSSAAANLTQAGMLEMPGFINQAEVARTLGDTRTLVFPSEHEPYGLSVTEAAAAGCAIVATTSSGCVGAHGSAHPNVNALTFEAGDVDALVRCLEEMLLKRELRLRMQAASHVIGASHSVESAAECIENAVLSFRE